MSFKNTIIFGDSYSTFKGYIPSGYAFFYSEDEKSVTDAVAVLSKLIGSNEKETGLKVAKERKLPVSEREDENYGQLRRAFGLV